MGFTTYHATHWKNGKIDRKAEIEEVVMRLPIRKDIAVIKSSMVGNEYYAAVQNMDSGRISAIVIITKVSGRQFAYKCLTENELPYYQKCPKKILALLSETDNENANYWRQKCLESAQSLKLSDIPVGAKIKAYVGSSTSPYILTKMAPAYQFKTPWFRTEDWKYMKKNHITKWELIQE